MIVNIRGTSGSGKSTLVRNIMKLYQQPPVVAKQSGRRQPIGYLFSDPGRPPLYVAGHYETECGGCDRIHSYDDNYANIRKAHDAGYHVLFEGLLMSAETRRLIELAQAVGMENVIVVGLDVPLQVCIDSVNQRRHTKRPDAPDVNPKNTESKWKGIRSAMRKLHEAGITCEWADRNTGFAVVKRLVWGE